MLSSSILISCPAYPLQNRPKISAKFCSSLSDSTVSMSCRPKRRCDVYDLHGELLPYAEAWSWQNAIVEEKKELNQRNEDLADSLIILQHHPVYTLGTGSSLEFLNFDVEDAPFDLYRTERGGEITYHGPGQLVMYPIINLRYHKMDLHWYLRALEDVVIRALSSAFSIKATRIDGLTGVWVGNKKLAAIGIKVSQWIAYHGLALNVTTETTPFQHIIPCGIRDRHVGTIKGLLEENAQRSCRQEKDELDDPALINCAYESLVREFGEVFQVELLANTYRSQFGPSSWMYHDEDLKKRSNQIRDSRI